VTLRSGKLVMHGKERLDFEMHYSLAQRLDQA
jgi:hypothetical protein